MKRRSAPVRRPTFLLVASSGGHLLELLGLSNEYARDERHWVTFDKPDARALLEGEEVSFAYHPTNRNLLNLVRNAMLAGRLLLTLRPRAIISTGAGVAVPFCYLGRMLRIPVVFVESFARVRGPSLTGQLVYPIATEFFVQWPALRTALPASRFEGTAFDLSEPRNA